MSANLDDPAVDTGLEKVNPHSNSQEGSTKECANDRTVAFISHASKVVLKIFCMLGFSIMQTKNFLMSKLGLEKEEEPEIKLPTFAGL